MKIQWNGHVEFYCFYCYGLLLLHLLPAIRLSLSPIHLDRVNLFCPSYLPPPCVFDKSVGNNWMSKGGKLDNLVVDLLNRLHLDSLLSHSGQPYRRLSPVLLLRSTACQMGTWSVYGVYEIYFYSTSSTCLHVILFPSYFAEWSIWKFNNRVMRECGVQHPPHIIFFFSFVLSSQGGECESSKKSNSILVIEFQRILISCSSNGVIISEWESLQFKLERRRDFA